MKMQIGWDWVDTKKRLEVDDKPFGPPMSTSELRIVLRWLRKGGYRDIAAKVRRKMIRVTKTKVR